MPRAKKALESPVSPSPKRPASVTAGSTMPPSAAFELEQEIRQRAYELYELSGREDGRAEEHWLRAEAEVRARRGERTA